MEYAIGKVIDIIHPVSRLHRKGGNHENGEHINWGRLRNWRS